MKHLLILFLFASVVIAVPTQAQSDPLSQQLDTYLTRLADLGFSGSVMIVDDEQIILNAGYGLANISTNEPNTSDTMFGIGSVTKLFTTAAILQLHEAGFLNVEDPVGMYLGNVPHDKAGITLVQLLNHKSGLETYHDTEGDFQPMSREEALHAILNAPLIATPGTEYHYSNSGFTLLAVLIEVVTGQSYQDYLRDHIFTPLRMRRSGFWGDSFDDVAYTSNVFDGYGEPSNWEYSWVLVGNGGIVSSNADLYRFFTALLDYELISPETTAYWQDVNQLRGWGNSAGGGSASDYNASLNFNLNSNIIMLNMTNSDLFPAELVNLRLQAIVDGQDVSFPPDISGSMASENPLCSVGVYSLDADNRFTVSADVDGLTITASGQEAVNLLSGTNSPQLQAQYARLAETANALIASASEGHFSPLANAFDVDVPASELARLWSQLESDYGAFVAYEVIGTSASQSGELEMLTVVHLRFATSEVYLRMIWNTRDELVGFAIERAGEFTQRRLFAVSEDTFTTFSLQSDTNVSLRFLRDGESAHALQISKGGEYATARRQESGCA